MRQDRSRMTTRVVPLRGEKASDARVGGTAARGPATTGKRGVSLATVRRLVLGLPGVEEGTSYGMPSFKLGGKFFARLRDDDTVLVVHLRSFDDRDTLLEHEPAAFFITDHYRNYPTVLVRLAQVRARMLEDVLMDAWRRGAPRRLLKEQSDSFSGDHSR